MPLPLPSPKLKSNNVIPVSERCHQHSRQTDDYNQGSQQGITRAGSSVGYLLFTKPVQALHCTYNSTFLKCHLALYCLPDLFASFNYLTGARLLHCFFVHSRSFMPSQYVLAQGRTRLRSRVPDLSLVLTIFCIELLANPCLMSSNKPRPHLSIYITSRT